jgi:hypothetical protein
MGLCALNDKRFQRDDADDLVPAPAHHRAARAPQNSGGKQASKPGAKPRHSGRNGTR